MPETTVTALPVLQAASSAEDLANAAGLRDQTPHAYEIAEPAEVNAVRALNVAGPFADYMRLVGDSDEDLHVGMYDLLADLRHLSDAVGVEWHDVDETAHQRYQEEVAGEL
ncbi:MAG: hypothetical protein EOP32_17695 [Rhodococcus sp. (in: high G+C Gram-positive bacteria)]|nr:MAG: hypothetical protein EOP32_17695 [Rhodococcus sp. (in: high G+C Gram-positive bacteria)]